MSFLSFLLFGLPTEGRVMEYHIFKKSCFIKMWKLSSQCLITSGPVNVVAALYSSQVPQSIEYPSDVQISVWKESDLPTFPAVLCEEKPSLTKRKQSYLASKDGRFSYNSWIWLPGDKSPFEAHSSCTLPPYLELETGQMRRVKVLN